jgi:dUTP pyrophosphatase
VRVAIQRLPHARDLPLPDYATPGSAGMDLRAAVEMGIELDPGARVAVPTGISIALPDGHEAQIRPRSGLALRDGVTVLNTPGTIDSDYRGEISVIIINLGEAPFRIARGLKIAQMVIARYETIEMVEAEELPATRRGAGGFGSTGQ